jgi:hypothetical protein
MSKESEEVQEAIDLVAAVFKYIQDLHYRINILDKAYQVKLAIIKLTRNVEKRKILQEELDEETDLSKLLVLAKIIGRAERKVNKPIHKILKALDKVDGTNIKRIAKQVKIPNKLLLRGASGYFGTLSKHLRKLNKQVKLDAIYPRQSRETKIQLELNNLDTDVGKLETSAQSLEASLRNLSGSQQPEFMNKEVSRRTILEGATAMAAAAIVFKTFPLLAQISKPKKNAVKAKVDAKDLFQRIIAEPSLEVEGNPIYSSSPNARIIILVPDTEHDSPLSQINGNVFNLRTKFGLNFVGVEGWAGPEVDKKRGYQLLNGPRKFIRHILQNKQFQVIGLEDSFLQDFTLKAIFIFYFVIPYLRQRSDLYKRKPLNKKEAEDQKRRYDAYRKAAMRASKEFNIKWDAVSMQGAYRDVVNFLEWDAPANLFHDINKGHLYINRDLTYSVVKKGQILAKKSRVDQRSKIGIKLMEKGMKKFNKNVGIIIFGMGHTESILAEFKKTGNFNILTLKAS